MSAAFMTTDAVTVHHGKYQDVLPTLEAVDVVICDPPYSEHIHGNARSRRMQSANDRGGRYGADLRRNVDLGFDHLTADDRDFLAREFARLARRWVLVFSDVESAPLWRESLTGAGLDYVRTGAWIKRGSTPQFSGDRPATGFEAITIAHPKGRKKWNGGGESRCVGRTDRAEPCTEARARAHHAEAAVSDGATGAPLLERGRDRAGRNSGFGHDGYRGCEAWPQGSAHRTVEGVLRSNREASQRATDATGRIRRCRMTLPLFTDLDCDGCEAEPVEHVYADETRGHIAAVGAEASAAFTDTGNSQLHLWAFKGVHLTPDMARSLGGALIAWAERRQS